MRHVPSRRFAFLSVLVLLALFAMAAAAPWRARTLARSDTLISLQQTFCIGSAPCVLTYHNDNSRDGVQPNETQLSVSHVRAGLSVVQTPVTDGLLYGQPLYIHGLRDDSGNVGDCHETEQGAGINTVFAATQNNSVYAFDATGAHSQPCWQVSLNQNANETAIPFTILPNSSNGYPCSDLAPEVGITSTPVIDASVTPPVMYVVTVHRISTRGHAPFSYAQRLHAIDATTGEEIAPYADIGATLGPSFNPLLQMQRVGLALYSTVSHGDNVGQVYVAYASHCDSNSASDGTSGLYNGWVAEFQLDYSNLAGGIAPLGSFVTESSPNSSSKGGIWMSGAAPAVDAAGNVYLAVGNGLWTRPGKTQGWGGTVLKLRSGSRNSGPSEADYYTVNVWKQLNSGTRSQDICTDPACTEKVKLGSDSDLGASGVILLSPSQLIAAGKEGVLYLVNYSASANGAMGGLDGCGYNCSDASNPLETGCSIADSFPSPGNISQCFLAVPFISVKGSGSSNGLRGSPAFWAPASQTQYAFMAGLHDCLRAYQLDGDTFDNEDPVYASDSAGCTANLFSYPGGGVSVSWDGNGTSSGIVWALAASGFGNVSFCNSKGDDCMNPPPPQYYTPASAATLAAYTALPQGSPAVLKYIWDTSKLKGHKTLMPGAVKFDLPTVADGYVFIPGGVPGYFGQNTNGCPAGTTLTCNGQLTILH